jgi:hypothetical protein
MTSRLFQYLSFPISLSLFAGISGCSPTPPSQMEATELAKSALVKYFSSLFKFQAHMQAENQSIQDGARSMLDSLGSNANSDASIHKPQAQIESELSSRAEAEAEKNA